MWTSVFLLPFWFAYILEIALFFLVNLAFGISTTVSICRLLMIIKVNISSIPKTNPPPPEKKIFNKKFMIEFID